MNITKAVIPCGGLGTRFLPVTKSVPKELLPIIDLPAVAHIVSEAAESGITDVLLVLAPGKEAIRHYFTFDAEFHDKLCGLGKQELAMQIKNTAKKVNISYVTQNQPRGSADAVYLARSFTGGEPFCLAWGDDVMMADTPVMRQLIASREQADKIIVGVQYFGGDDIVKYGVAQLEGDAAKSAAQNRLINCRGFVEKPKLSDIPSRYAALGRYVLTDEIYSAIEELEPVSGEYRLTDAINNLATRGKVCIYDFEGKRFDVGDRLGAVKAAVEFGLKREFGAELKEYLKNLVAEF